LLCQMDSSHFFCENTLASAQQMVPPERIRLPAIGITGYIVPPFGTVRAVRLYDRQLVSGLFILGCVEGSVLIFLPEPCCRDVQQFAVLRNGSSR
jgi:hypothetical protein